MSIATRPPVRLSARPSVLTVLLTVLPTVLTGQATDTTRLPEITVVANRAPTPFRSVGSSTDLLLNPELQRRQRGSLREALGLVAGGASFSNGAPGAVTSVFMRGASSSQTLLLVDGIRVNDANTSYGSFLGGADLTGLGRLEVVRGPQSTLYGGAAIGGVVSMDAARGRGPGNVEAELEGGSFAAWRGALVGTAGSERSGVLAAFTANGTDNERRPNLWRQRTQLVRLDRAFGERLSVGVTARGLQQRYVSPGDLRTSNTTPEGTTVFETHLATLWIEALPADRWRSRILLGGQEQFTQGTGRFNGSPEFKFNLSNSRRVVEWQNTVSLSGSALLTAGVNREWSTATTDGAEQDERLWAFYAQARVSPAAPVTLTAGVRSDDYTTFDDAVTWRVTGAWHLARSDTKLRASYGTGFMPPGLLARYGSVFQNPNPGIRPERSRGWDAGVDQGFLEGRGSLSVTWFHNALRDLIGFEGAAFPALGRNVNVDRARTQGLEVSGRLAAGPVDARLAWTILSARSLSESEPSLSRLIRRPKHSLAADVAVAVAPRATIGAGVVAIADRQDTDFNEFPAARVDPGDYAVARLYGSWDLTARITLRARAENLFDARYEPVFGFPGLGRSVTAGVFVTLSEGRNPR
jgi:vitamin B12 transporter